MREETETPQRGRRVLRRERVQRQVAFVSSATRPNVDWHSVLASQQEEDDGWS